MNFKVSFLGKQLAPVEAAREVAVILDTSLTFDDQVTATVASCMSRLGQINRVQHCFNKRTLIIIINALVLSKLFSFIALQSGTILHNLTSLNSKLAVQNFACRIVSGSRNAIMLLPFS